MTIKKLPQTIVKVYLQRYPIQLRLSQFNVLSRYSWLQPILADIYDELFPKAPDTVEETKKAISEPVVLPKEAGVQFFNSPYKRYRCSHKDPLRCDRCCPTAEDESRIKACQLCGFPTLLPFNSEIKGDRGTYRIEKYLGRRGIGRLYAATQQGINEPVVIKEYLLPGRYFNEDEIRQHKQMFNNLAGISLADGRVQDFRFLQPLEAIGDALEERCYLIIDRRYDYPTLNGYLSLAAMSDRQVKKVVHQVLQTLEFLHSQKFRLKTGGVQNGIVHGNLNLDTLLLIKGESFSQDNLDFFIYLSDLAVWERLFDPTQDKSISSLKKSEDLISLGYIGFYLLAGRVVTDGGEPLDPKNEKHWKDADPKMKAFLLRLMELELPFENAFSARQELQRLPSASLALARRKEAEPEIEPVKKFPRLLVLLLSAMGLGMVGWLVWILINKPQPSTARENAPKVCCLKDVAAIPPGKFTYTSTRDGIWYYVLRQPDLIAKDRKLEQTLQAAQPKLDLSYQPAESTADAIAKVQSGQTAFAIVPLIQPLPTDLEAQIIAYDGIAVFVAFSYAQREKGLPQKLNGQITLEQLRQLYANKIDSWAQLGASELPVKLYAPKDKEMVEVFEQLMLSKKGDTENKNEKYFTASNLRKLPDFEMMRTVIQDFESRQIGGVGFSSLSKIVGQCSVYPLALQGKAQPPQQVIVLNNNRDIDPNTDLCDKKGSYHPKVDLLKNGQYPLAYPIAIVYSRDNDRPPIGEKFAEILKTLEGQRLLSQTGLTPLK
ncbi:MULTISPECIES: substrate-binding domain-containing protein [unclassified Nostoc]|uniref:substrate-binding domain-containing protein n=1 Tax=unclassified Nostoc TaxID=2593658 RepID=UPI002AD405F7|nr:substrate-binding domain-containing protein [Nostoc sp. DedQUE03]MDZ7973108.1 phosphate ABC transporter substrate-binding protein [Nostoc sp. DedQUE03]MDZ8046923.1 phosphate ABC transporter substrate-binding protein [Nostoc sp. DedQUE02]